MTRTNLKIKNLELCAKAALASVKVSLFVFAGLFLLSGFSVSFAQVKAEPKPAASPRTPSTRSAPRPPRTARTARRVHNESEIPAEKSILTDAKVNITLCISEGNVKINGWDRNEIRAFVSEGSEVGFSIRSKNKQSGKPNWVEIQGFDPQKNLEAGLDECLSGDEIEIDVPRGSTINLTSTEAAISISSVNKVKVNNDGGSISLNNIAQGIEAKTYHGGVTVENSSGEMTLNSTTGNIVAFEAQADEIGDVFIAKTISGAITLQQVAHRQIEVGSNSGSIRFDGDFTSGGQYSFGTTNGSISLIVPEAASSKITATYAGAFQSDLPLKNVQKTSGSPVILSALLNSGDASLNLRTFGGAIRIRKK